ncbi:helix-turn-helix transcriptional regulator [Sorangium sp. So ce281]|uniref:helix-turn-helix domain-containing protein n=2 Tax=unclassified Sorangium TaxID=2621164 RepID=UPI003F5D9ACB
MNVAAAMDLLTLALPRFVEDIRAVAPPPGQALDLEWLPDGRTGLFFRALEGGREGDVWVAGPRTRAIFKSKTGLVRMVTLRFRPGWSVPLLGVTASELTDRIVPLEDVWGRAGRELCGDLLAARSRADVIDRVARALTLRAGQPLETASGQLARRAVRLLEGGEVRVENVADRLGVTARHLRRAFTENVGIGPKEFARAVRLQRAVRMAATSCDWARIAADAGYYDQAHLIADFHQLVGLTPGAFLKRASGRMTRSPCMRADGG